jgi:hypothetical protein
MKTVYLFDQTTGEYQGVYNAYPSPLEPGDFIVPSASTEVVPPVLNSGEKAVFASGTWTVVPPTPALQPTLEQAQTTQLSAIDEAYQRANTQPIAYMGTTFQADDASTTLMVKTITIMQNTGTLGCTWWDASNTGIDMTLAQLVGLGATIFARGQIYFAHKQTQKAAIRAAADIATIGGIIW